MTPTKAKTVQYTYTFSGWDKEISAVNGDITYTAQYDSTLSKYTITWKNFDGTILETDYDVVYGTVPAYDGNTPVKAADNTYTYTFNGWDKAVVNCAGDVTYTATYIAKVLESLAITTDLKDCTAAVDEDFSFTIKVNKEDVTYKWQYSDNGTQWLYSSVIGNVYSGTMTEAKNGRYVRCTVTCGNETVTSSVAQMKLG